MAQLTVVGVRVASASCAVACDMGQGIAQRTLGDAGSMADLMTSTSAHAMSMPMPAHDAVPADGAPHDAPPHDAAPESCLAGVNCAPPLAIIALAGLDCPTLVAPAPALRVAAMLTRAAAAPEAPPPKA